MFAIRRLILCVAMFPIAYAVPRLGAQEGGGANDDLPAIVQSMRNRAVAFLKSQRPSGVGDVPNESSEVGESALMAYALLNAGVPANDEKVASLIRLVAERCTGQFVPEIRDGRDNYEAGLACMALAEADPDQYRGEIAVVAKYLQRKQTSRGAWDYNNGTTGDTSMTQMAILGLWVAARAGVDVPSRVWQSAANWLVSTQYPSGGFAYHPGGAQATHSMTAGGLSSLYICRAQLSKDPTNAELLQGIDMAIARGKKWFADNFTVTKPTGHFHYYFYSLERYTAFSDQKFIGSHDWYREGFEELQERQRVNGGWEGLESGSSAVHTSFALLFLVQATHRIRNEITALGGGALLAGRGLPSDLSLITIQRGRLVIPPIKVTLDELLKRLREGKLNRPVQLQPESADDAEIEALKKLGRDPDPAVREKAIWSLGRLRRYEVVPVLIRALEDPDGGVRHEASQSLRQLSRKPQGFGLPAAATPEQSKEAVEKWTRWYRSVRPYDEFNTLN